MLILRYLKVIIYVHGGPMQTLTIMRLPLCLAVNEKTAYDKGVVVLHAQHNDSMEVARVGALWKIK